MYTDEEVERMLGGIEDIMICGIEGGHHGTAREFLVIFQREGPLGLWRLYSYKRNPKGRFAADWEVLSADQRERVYSRLAGALQALKARFDKKYAAEIAADIDWMCKSFSRSLGDVRGREPSSHSVPTIRDNMRKLFQSHGLDADRNM